MNLLVENSAAFKARIDKRCRPDDSIVLRYRHAIRFAADDARDRAFKGLLGESSIREGARIAPLLTYKGIEVHILDETSGMATGSVKAIDGCLAAALCRMEGTGRIAFESGGNTGAALTQYGRQAGLETFFFCPADNLDLLNGRLFDNLGSHLIAVEERGRVKEFTELFTRRAGVRRLPDKSWRYIASRLRGLHLLEMMLAGNRYDWIVQTVSAAFGPIGIYQVLSMFQAELGGVPRFLGVQQKANCPMYAAWKSKAADAQDGGAGERLLTRVMYDRAPQTYQTFGDLRNLLLVSRGDLLTVDAAEFHAYGHLPEFGSLADLLRSRGVMITSRDGEVLEKTGMIALAGTLKAIENGAIPRGSRVLCSLTGGVSEADGRAHPERVLRTTGDVLAYVEGLGTGG